MTLKVFRFAVTMLAALSLSIGVGYLMQLPARLAWDQYLWVGSTVQGGFYRLSGPVGILLQAASLIGLIVLAALERRHRGAGFALTAMAALLYAAGLVLWWIFVYPANVELAGWVNGPVPDNWTVWRARWEWGQVANGLAQLLGFAALLASLLAATPSKDGS
jgi:hypothetical protein